jgi:cytochrome c oxidase assembly protein subunit 15
MTLLNLIRLSLVMTFVVIMLGAYTRLADAGLGCPDWPGCYGQLSVPTQQDELTKANALYPELTVEAEKAWLEMIHRYFAGSLGLVVFAITAVAMKTRLLSRCLAVSLTAVVVFQALLGMWTVTMKLMPVVVMGHLLGGFTLFSLLALSYWKLQSNKPIFAPKGLPTLRLLSGIALLAIIGQIALGGWTSSNYAALMCTSLPICQGDWQSHLDVKHAFELIQPQQDSYEYGTLDYGARMTIHVSHRIGAMVVTFITVILSLSLYRSGERTLQRLAKLMTLLLIAQLGLGIGNVLLSLPLPVAVAHNLGAALLLICLLRVNYVIRCVREPAKNSAAGRMLSLQKEHLHE